MEWLFVMKDRGTSNAGYWLKITSIEEYMEYLKITNPTRYGKAFENYVYGKDYGAKTNSHGPHLDAEPLTQAIVMHATNMNEKYGTKMNIIDAIKDFSSRVFISIELVVIMVFIVVWKKTDSLDEKNSYGLISRKMK